MCFVHASAHNPTRWDYVDTPAAARRSAEAAQATYTFSGHVHDQALYFEGARGNWSVVPAHSGQPGADPCPPSLAGDRRLGRAAPRRQSRGGLRAVRPRARADHVPSGRLRQPRARRARFATRVFPRRMPIASSAASRPARDARFKPPRHDHRRLSPGRVHPRRRAGAHLSGSSDADAGFPAVMKVPRVGPDEPSENLISFETEASILPALSGPHVPRFVAAGDLSEAALPRGRMDQRRDAREVARSAASFRWRTSRASARRSPMRCTASICRMRSISISSPTT